MTILWLWIGRLAAGGALLWAGATKALDPDAFAQAVANFRLLPRTAAVAVALFLPWLEILVGLAVLLGRPLYRGALLLTAVLYLVFTAALLSALARGLPLSCGCFGGAAAEGSARELWRGIVRNGALLAVTAALIVREARRSPPSPP